MAVAAAAVLPAALLEDDDLVQPVLRDHGRGDRGAGNRRTANGEAAVASNTQNVVERHGGTGFSLQLFHLQHHVGGDAVLFSAGADDSEHVNDFPGQQRPAGGPGGLGSAGYSGGGGGGQKKEDRGCGQL